ncbi:hypothetical protein SNOG_09143 [Parastagonospora nodorum SN15]|uniref:Uncharacterized protein n=1 Tax=Phaeosphaeria nodorum (strain SN15 / ATCC MYA-4574 / FGSC 10173) TaxID=321614 RepID=Q0UGH1_PHANO|nr:hypothetical protein SNOG_09143 [Parastagonospora nodorum SN15]EAT83335.1 hypothetical protein SNOG_09143 [Parastagonospora nodorum SN15]
MARGRINVIDEVTTQPTPYSQPGNPVRGCNRRMTDVFETFNGRGCKRKSVKRYIEHGVSVMIYEL